MSSNETLNPNRPENGRTPHRKKYEKPAIAWEQATQVRQNLAAACGLVEGGGGNCEGSGLS